MNLTFNDFLTETHDLPSIKQWYAEYNAKLFNNELPKDLIIKFNRSKKTGAKVVASINTKIINGKKVYNNDSLNIKHMIISTLHNRTEEDIRGILLHEMIHVWAFVNGIIHTTGGDKSHGKEFLDKLKEIQAKVSVKIPLTEETTNLEVNDKGKTFYIALLRNNKYAYVISFSKLFYLNNNVEIKNRLEQNIHFGWLRTEEFFLGTSKFPKIENYPAKRSFKFGAYKIPLEMAETIKNEMDVQYHIIKN